MEKNFIIDGKKYRWEAVRLPRKKKKQQKKLLRGSLPQGQKNLLHYPKTGSTFIFYWHKNKIKMKTLGKMTMTIKAQGSSVAACIPPAKRCYFANIMEEMYRRHDEKWGANETRLPIFPLK